MIEIDYDLIEKSVIRKADSEVSISDVLNDTVVFLNGLQDQSVKENAYYWAKVIDEGTGSVYYVYSDAGVEKFGVQQIKVMEYPTLKDLGMEIVSERVVVSGSRSIDPGLKLNIPCNNLPVSENGSLLIEPGYLYLFDLSSKIDGADGQTGENSHMALKDDLGNTYGFTLFLDNTDYSWGFDQHMFVPISLGTDGMSRELHVEFTSEGSNPVEIQHVFLNVIRIPLVDRYEDKFFDEEVKTNKNYFGSVVYRKVFVIDDFTDFNGISLDVLDIVDFRIKGTGEDGIKFIDGVYSDGVLSFETEGLNKAEVIVEYTKVNS